MISSNTIQQIQSRIDIIEIIGGFMKLKKRGANYIGLCPFHNEKTPSFSVSPSKEIYKCFGCGRSGNAIGFLMEHEKYSYTEALRWLGNKYNVPIEETAKSPEALLQQQVADSLYIINGFARDFFKEQLMKEEEGQNIGLSYLKERGFQEAIIQKFELGYAPRQKEAFTTAALAAQYNPELLNKAGLIIRREEQWIDNYFEQGTAYSLMYKERVGNPINQIVIIISVDGQPEPQIFIKEPIDYVDSLINKVWLYKKEHKNVC